MDEKFFIENPLDLFRSTNILWCEPCNDTREKQFNSLVRLILLITLILYLTRYKKYKEFAMLSILLVIIIYYFFKRDMMENYEASNFVGGTLIDKAQPNPIDLVNGSNSIAEPVINYVNAKDVPSKEVMQNGFDYQNGSFWSLKHGKPNPKTELPIVNAPNAFDMSVWGSKTSVPSFVNEQRRRYDVNNFMDYDIPKMQYPYNPIQATWKPIPMEQKIAQDMRRAGMEAPPVGRSAPRGSTSGYDGIFTKDNNKMRYIPSDIDNNAELPAQRYDNLEPALKWEKNLQENYTPSRKPPQMKNLSSMASARKREGYGENIWTTDNTQLYNLSPTNGLASREPESPVIEELHSGLGNSAEEQKATLDRRQRKLEKIANSAGMYEDNFEDPYSPMQKTGNYNELVNQNFDRKDLYRTDLPSNLSVVTPNGEDPRFRDSNQFKYRVSQTDPTMTSTFGIIEPLNDNIGISYNPQYSYVDTEFGPKSINHFTSTYSDPSLVRDHDKDFDIHRGNWSKKTSAWDTPDGSINVEDIYDPRLTGAGDPYSGYFDTNSGRYRYYYRQTEAYKYPLFISRNNVDHIDLLAEDGSVWPRYNRDSDNQDYRDIVEQTYVADDLYRREDMMERLMRKQNRRDYQLRLAPLRSDKVPGTRTI